MPVYIEVDKDRADRIHIAAQYHMNDLIKTIPGATWSKTYSRWTIPLSWTGCLAARTIFGNDLLIGPELSQWAKNERASRIDPAMALRDALDAPGDADLYGYQRAGVQFLITAERALLCDEMGSGKTITTIRAVKKLHDDGKDVFPMLVVCPNTMKRTWAKELDKWWPGVTSVVVGGTAVQRRKQIESGAQIIIINWEGLRSHSRLAKYGSLALRRCQECGGSGTVKEGQCQTHERELNHIDFNTVIADELHRSKNPSSQVAMALRGASGAAHYRFGLTGTPISGNPVEMWPLLHWIDEREWPAKTKWVDRMVSYTYDLWGGMEVTGIRPEAEDEFHASINPRMRRMTKDVVLPFLPPKVYEQRDVALTGKQGKAYQQMADDLVAKLDSGILLSANPMVQTGRLIQFASAYGDLEVLPDGSDRLVLTDPSNKIDAFMADLEDFDGQAVVVFAQSKQLINLLSSTLTKKGIRHGLITGDQDTAQRQRTIEDFQDGHFNMVLCTIQAGGVGITLTRASVAVFLQRSWSPIDMQQAEDRIHRIGSEIHESVLIVNYVTPDTVEEAQIWALKHKNDLLQEIVRDADLMKKFLTGEIK